jgi:hypothetical protein
VLQRLPFPVDVIRTDNGAEFQSAFHYHVLDKAVGHLYIKPRTPRLNGKVGEDLARRCTGRSDPAKV